MNTNLIARLATTAVVCAGSFYVSFRHITEVAMHAGNSADVAYVFPVTIDAVILVCTLTLVASTGVNKMAKMWATIGRIFGFAATIFCNMAASGWHNPGAIVINMIPAIALIVTVELMVYGWKATPAAKTPAARRTQSTPKTAAKAAAPRKAAAKATTPAKLTAVK